MKFTIPANAYKAVALAQSTEETRYYLRGVYVENESLTATNGHILLRYEIENGTGIDEGEPFIMALDTTEKGFKEDRKRAGKLMMFGDTETKIIEFHYVDKDGDKIGKRHSVCGFDIIDGNFPDYKRVIPNHEGSSGLNHVAFDTKYMAVFSKASKLMGGQGNVALTFGDDASNPIFVDLGEKYEPFTGVLMPTRSSYR